MMLRPALCVVSLLLLAAAGAHYGLSGGHAWSVGAPPWIQQLQWEAAQKWHYGAGAAATAAAAVPPPSSTRVVHASLQLPGNTLHELGTDALVEELLGKLLGSQAGARLPHGVQIVSVEQESFQRASPLHAAATALASALRLPASWGAPQPHKPVPLDQPAAVGGWSKEGEKLAAADQSGGEQPANRDEKWASGSNSGAAVEEWESSGSADAAEEWDGSIAEDLDQEKRAPATAFDVASSGGSDPADSQEQRLPTTVFDGPEELRQDQHPHPASSSEGTEQWQPTKLFGPRRPALPVAQQAQREAQHAQQGAASRAPAVHIRVVVVVREQLEGPLASLLDQLALPEPQQQAGSTASSSSSSGDASSQAAQIHQWALATAPAEARLGRKGAAGLGGSGGTAIRLRVVVREQSIQPAQGAGGQQAQQQQLMAAGGGVVATLDDATFVAVAALALVCMALLAQDVCRQAWPHRWTPCPEHQHQQQWGQRQAPLLVVAADEVARDHVAALHGKHAVLHGMC